MDTSFTIQRFQMKLTPLESKVWTREIFQIVKVVNPQNLRNRPNLRKMTKHRIIPQRRNLLNPRGLRQ